MITTHEIYFENANRMLKIPAGSVDLVVTSPPYPMIKMWDDLFISLNPEISKILNAEQGTEAFESMHQQLDRVWGELFRILKTGGIACINIGDATRTLGKNFALFSSHARILNYLTKLGFSVLPAILWRKQTNAPNKFMGSGMLAPGAYVTLEHEYILIVRKGGKRDFSSAEEKANRAHSAYFWEERNNWFSDIWMDLKGTGQNLFDKDTRSRSAAFPFELAYRLISMFSVKGDVVVDPFLGLGTTMFAAATAARNSIGFEIDAGLSCQISAQFMNLVPYANQRIHNRLQNHLIFVEQRIQAQKTLKHQNEHYKFPVITRQEKTLLLNSLVSIKQHNQQKFEAQHDEKPQEQFINNAGAEIHSAGQKPISSNVISPKKKGEQLDWFD